ncbi:MAG: hypothetical protein HZA15_06835 [Nitrospirae bacterium]|nr:hypothetical protein [Nitrospirota bacterium]
MYLKLVFTMLFILSVGRTVLADDYNHQHKKPVTMQMKTQHRIMTVINNEWNAAKKAIDSGDLRSAEKSLQTILDKSQYMEKFVGYKNADKHAEFISEYHLFVTHVKNLRDKISGQDSSAPESLKKEIQDSCIRCHAKFK